MAYKKRFFKKKFTKRRAAFKKKRVPFNKRRRRYVSPNTRVLRLSKPFLPKTAIVNHTYIDLLNLAPSGGQQTSAIRQLRLNSVYDPIWVSGGFQPQGYDVFASLYRTYTVLSCSYQITWAVEPNSTGSEGASDEFEAYGDRHMFVGTNVYTADTSVIPSSLSAHNHFADPNTRYREINPVPGNTSMVRMSGKVNMSRFLNMQVGTENALRVSYNANPPDRLCPLLTVWYRNTGNTGSNIQRCRCTVRLSFRTMWRDPIVNYDS